MTDEARPPVDHTNRPIRSRIEATLLDIGAPMAHEAWGWFLAQQLDGVTGTIVELGPGTGANMRWFPDGVEVIGIEPNPVMHDRLLAAAREHDVDYEVRGLRGEDLDLPDASADLVLATLVLCGVDDPAKVVAEVRRVLRPGGRFVFVEHVGASDGSLVRRVQGVMRRPHRWMFNGCDVTRDTEATIRAGGFAEVDVWTMEGGMTDLYVRPVIRGVATA